MTAVSLLLNDINQLLTVFQYLPGESHKVPYICFQQSLYRESRAQVHVRL
jgi:hypothetical protein